MQGGFIGKPGISNPERMAQQQGSRVFLRAGADGRCQFPRPEAGGANHHRIHRVGCAPRHFGHWPGGARPFIE